MNMPNPRRETIDRIKTILRKDLKLGDIDIPDDMAFFGSDADFDSLDILLLMTSIEKQFKVKVPSESVGKQIFQSVSTLAQYIDENGSAVEAGGAAGPQEARVDSLDRLPHREPFRFLSRIIAITAGESGEGAWAVTGQEAFFAGHFPGNPLVPGVLIAEVLAQLSGLVGPHTGSGNGKLAHVDIRFEQSVTPPAEIRLHSKLVRTMGDLQQFEVLAQVAGAVVARGNLALSRA